MTTSLHDLHIKTQLLLLCTVMIAGFVIFGILSFSTIAKIQINGPIYKSIVDGKDLIADILPPPQYILESYLTILQAHTETDPEKQKMYVEKLKSLREEYDRRHEFWTKELSQGPMKELLLKKSYEPAVAFYEKVDKEFLPAIMSHDTTKADALTRERK